MFWNCLEIQIFQQVVVIFLTNVRIIPKSIQITKSHHSQQSSGFHPATCHPIVWRSTKQSARLDEWPDPVPWWKAQTQQQQQQQHHHHVRHICHHHQNHICHIHICKISHIHHSHISYCTTCPPTLKQWKWMEIESVSMVVIQKRSDQLL